MGFATMFDELLCVLLSCFLLTCQTFRERDGLISCIYGFSAGHVSPLTTQSA